MINLTLEAKRRGTFTLDDYFRHLFDPDIYLAQDIADLREEAPTIIAPWPARLSGDNRCYIILHNVGIESHPESFTSEFYRVSDATDEMVVLWPNEKNRFFATNTRQDEIPGIIEGERVVVHELFVCYLVRPRLAIVAEVEHRPPPRRPKRDTSKATLMDRIREGLALPEPA